MNINSWPQWQPDITSTKLYGELKAGNIFRWKAKGLGFLLEEKYNGANS
ncbi:MAG: hypothetical protein NTW69_16270 [Chloroflexi bacterium]|nr:hypothetical protein [Chloroflexota bacterium]